MQDSPAIVVPFQERKNERASTFPIFLRKPSVYTGILHVFRMVRNHATFCRGGRNIPLLRTCYVNWKSCGEFS
jgi:hypothetical protein